MAKALICDYCGKTFPETATSTGTGKWHKIRGQLGAKRIHVVYGVFAVPETQNLMAIATMTEPKGVPVDICPECVTKFLTEGEPDDGVPESGDSG